MKQMDRRLLILTRLRATRAVRAADLAEDCGCSVRTVYRDIDALCDAGIPIAALAGEGYRLAPGYHLPPIAFTADEASQLLLGTDLALGLGTTAQRDAAAAAAAKVEAVLGAETEREVERRRERVQVAAERREPSPWLPVALQAVLEDRVLRLRYHAFASGQQTEREVEPYQLVFYGDDWHLMAHCRLRNAVRDFRLARVDEAVLSDERFERPAELRSEIQPSGTPGENRRQEVHVWLSDDVVRWAREDPGFGFRGEEPAESGAVFVFDCYEPRRLLPWVLGWGGAARVLAPPDFIDRVRAEVRSLSDLYLG
jgi:predicted DNA-binding transcriptional regulator YafY